MKVKKKMFIYGMVIHHVNFRLRGLTENKEGDLIVHIGFNGDI